MTEESTVGTEEMCDFSAAFVAGQQAAHEELTIDNLLLTPVDTMRTRARYTDKERALWAAGYLSVIRQWVTNALYGPEGEKR
jgi:hypothetical protein